MQSSFSMERGGIMANFKLIYQILTLLDKYLDHDDPV